MIYMYTFSDIFSINSSTPVMLLSLNQTLKKSYQNHKIIHQPIIINKQLIINHYKNGQSLINQLTH